MSRDWKRLLTAALLLPLLVLASSSQGSMAMACATLGIMQDECCCPPQIADAEQPEQKGSSIEAASCCDVIRTQAQQIPSAFAPQLADLSLLPAWVALPTGTFVVAARPGSWIRLPLQARTPDSGRDLLLVKRSFLI